MTTKLKVNKEDESNLQDENELRKRYGILF